jgi:hypothetical protein
MKYNFFKLLAFSFIIVLISCDKDAVNINSDLKGAQNFSVNRQEYPVTLFSKATGSVQTNEMPTTYLGAFKDNTFETTTTANVITEIIPTTFSPDFGPNPSIESVILTIPYFSEVLSTDENGESTYELQSLLGNPDAKYKLSIYKSDYLLRDLDPATNFEEPQAYYSDFYDTNIASQISGYTKLYEIENFKPSNEEIDIVTVDADGETLTTRFPPGIRIDLLKNSINDTSASNTAFWNDLLGIEIDPTTGENTQNTKEYLSSSNNFKEFFRGLIFQVEITNPINPGNIIAIDIANTSGAGITLDYTNSDEDVPDFIEDPRNPSEYRFIFSGITLNTLNNSPEISISGGNETDGDDHLKIRGFNGAFTVVDLFGTEDLNNNDIPDTLEEFKSNKDKWLINEASVTFKLNENFLEGDEPKRVMLYNLKNKQPIVDYFFDLTSNSNPDQSRVFVSEPLEENTYKIRVTEYLNNIINRDSLNFKLGLFVSNNVNNVSFTKLKNPITIGTGSNQTVVDEIPLTSVSSGKGTIINGSTNNIQVEDKVKFEVYYTEEN